MKKTLLIAGVAAVLIALAAFKLSVNKKEAKAKLYIHDSNAAVLVEAARPETHTFNAALSFLGTFDPVRQNIIGSDASGKVIRINTEEGDHVSQGQILAKVDDELLQLQLQGAEIAVEGQENDDKRYSSLQKDAAVSGVQVEKTKLGVRSAQVQKKQLQKQLRMTAIVAPFSGTITRKMIDLGSVIGPGAQLFEITDISSLKLTVSVPERDILKFKVGQKVDVFADIYGQRKFSGKVTNVNVVADKAHNFKVQITVGNADRKFPLMAGMYGSVKIGNNQSRTALAVPRTALVGSSKEPQVFVVENGKARLKSFSAGTSDGDFIEVISGLSASDRIVTKGQVNLQDGTPVKF